MAKAASSQNSDDKDYFLEFDKYGLHHVRLLPNGIKKIVENHYRKKGYDININSLLYDRFSAIDFGKKFKEQLQSLQDGQICGLIFISRSVGLGGVVNYAHATPVVIAKKGEKFSAVLFEDDGRIEDKISSFGCEIKKVLEYKSLQRDTHSCATFALDILKNCLIHPDFAAFTQSEGGSFEVKRKMAQGVDNIESWKKDPYALEVFGKEMNLASFYKGHVYGFLLDKEHLGQINDLSRGLIAQIHERRNSQKQSQPNPELQLKPLMHEMRMFLNGKKGEKSA